MCWVLLLLWRPLTGITPDPSGLYLMAPSQHSGKDMCPFGSINQAAKRIYELTEEFTGEKTLFTKTEEELSCGDSIPSPQQEAVHRQCHNLPCALENMDQINLIHRAICGDVGIPLKEFLLKEQQDLVKKIDVERTVLFIQISPRKGTMEKWEKTNG